LDLKKIEENANFKIFFTKGSQEDLEIIYLDNNLSFYKQFKEAKLRLKSLKLLGFLICWDLADTVSPAVLSLFRLSV